MRRMLYYFASLFTSAIFMIWSLWQSSSIHGASAIWHKITSQISVLLQREFSSVWDDNVKVDWKRRHKESFYPPQAAECRMRECKAGIDLGTEKTETGRSECNGIRGANRGRVRKETV